PRAATVPSSTALTEPRVPSRPVNGVRAAPRMTVDTAPILPWACVAPPPPLLAPAAGFWRRAAAFGIDWTIGAVLVGIAAGVVYELTDESDAAATAVVVGGLWPP